MNTLQQVKTSPSLDAIPEPTASTRLASPYVDLPRDVWADMAASTAVVLNEATLASLRGIGDPTSTDDVREVFHPLADLIMQYSRNASHLYRDSNAYLGLEAERTPFILGVAGSVAVGKSTVARLITELLRRSHGHPKVDLITTDGFLYPNSELARRGLLERKGFPESYDTMAMLQFVIDVKSGLPEVQVPVYSHNVYDILPGFTTVVHQPDILVIEGINTLQLPRPVPGTRASMLSMSDFFDFSVYVDAPEEYIRDWYVARFLSLRATAFQDPDSFFRKFANLDDAAAITKAYEVWDNINSPNLRENIEPTKVRATAILRKGHDHSVERLRIRKI
ncbi:MAG: type I pantothenate kinase [Propionibacteriaceae bacterium]|jgi:type I pantothenate kinase|nr:type I pantothenate kinase [Propionibacteriaceae bacterium]